MPYIVAFAAAALAAGLGRAVTTTYLPLLLERIDDAPQLIGMVMLVNAAAGMAVPLVTGMWSDRLERSGRGRRLPFIVGGSVVTAGGLAAMAFGFSTSYLVLALFAAVVYTGLNALTTAHRALVPETFDESGRARATSAQELALLAGGLVGLAVGGLLFEIAPWAPFALSAILVPLLAIPTIARVREPHVLNTTASPSRTYTATYYLHAIRRPGVGAFLLAQILWVLGYAALPAFFLLYAEDVLALEPGVASLWLAGFGLATGAAIVAAGRVRRPTLHQPLLVVGVLLLGGGFLGVASSTSLPVVGVALAIGATGFGLVTTLGFPLFSKLIPEGEAGGYTAHVLLRAGDRLYDRASGRRLDGRGDGELPFALRARRSRHARRSCSARRRPEHPRPRARRDRDAGDDPHPRPARGEYGAAAPGLVALRRPPRPRARAGGGVGGPRPAHAQLRPAPQPGGRGGDDLVGAPHSGSARTRPRIGVPCTRAARGGLRGLRPSRARRRCSSSSSARTPGRT